jgi:hypothetical protein
VNPPSVDHYHEFRERVFVQRGCNERMAKKSAGSEHCSCSRQSEAIISERQSFAAEVVLIMLMHF